MHQTQVTKRSAQRQLRLVPLAAALMLHFSGAADAATIAVNDPGTGSVGGKCTLSDAVSALNTAAAANACAAGDGVNDTIDLSFFTAATAITYALVAAGGDSALTLTKPARIVGPLDNSGNPLVTLARSTVSGTPAFRLIATSSDLAISGLAFTGGNSADRGGAIYASGYANLTLTHATVTANTAATSGGGVSTDCGNITLTSSRISGNTASKNGGGAYAADHIMNNGYFCISAITLNQSTVSGNSVATGSGGGAYAFNGSVYSDHATFDGNAANGRAGGGLYAYRQAKLYYTTVSNNSSVFGGGGVASQYVTTIGSTIANNTTLGPAGGIGSRYAALLNTTVTGNMAGGYGGAMNSPHVQIIFSTITGNTSTSSYQPIGGVRFGASALLIGSIITGNNGDNFYGTTTGNMHVSGNHNIIPQSPFAHTVTLPGDTMDCDPLLAPLANNGGPTQTMSLGAGSCAIDHGPASPDGTIASDQRGPQFARKVGAATDIGAFEVQSNDRIFYNGFR